MEIQYVIISSIGKTINKALPQDINCINILNKIIIRNMTYSIIWYKTNHLIQCFKAFNRWYYYFYATSVTSVISDSVRPCPWAYPGKNTGVGCHFLLQCIQVKSESEVTQPCPTLRDPMDCSLPGSSVHGIFQARVLEWVPWYTSKNTSFPDGQFVQSVLENQKWDKTKPKQKANN